MPERRLPQEKKQLSLDHDRRNDYHENNKASRKNIPKSKAQGQRRIRRTVNDKLPRGLEDVTTVDADAVDDRAKEVARKMSLKRFRKLPDVPLREVLAKKGKRAG
jgi:hypothetical protein